MQPVAPSPVSLPQRITLSSLNGGDLSPVSTRDSPFRKSGEHLHSFGIMERMTCTNQHRDPLPHTYRNTCFECDKCCHGVKNVGT